MLTPHVSCQHILSSQPVALLAWLRDREPETLEKTRWIFACKDYVRFRLTGEAYAERTDYSGCNFVNLHTGAYDPELKAQCKETGDNSYEVMNQWVEEIPAEEFCPVYLPFLMASNVHPNALGGFVGMSNFLKTRTEPPKSIRLAGGAASAIEKMVRIAPAVRPNPAMSAIYDEKYVLYCKTIEALDGLWDSMQAYRDKHQ